MRPAVSKFAYSDISSNYVGGQRPYQAGRIIVDGNRNLLRRNGQPYVHHSKLSNPLTYDYSSLKKVAVVPPAVPLQSPVESNVAPGFGFPGLQQVLSTELGLFPRFLWLLVFCGCTGICLFQLFDRGSLYLQEPTSVNVLVTRNQTVTFPAFTLCAGSMAFFAAITNTLHPDGAPPGDVDFTPFDENNINLDQLWEDYALSEYALNVTIRTQMPTSYNGRVAQFPGIKSHRTTAFCNCLTYRPGQLLELEGKTSVRLSIDQDAILPKRFFRNSTPNFYYRFHADDLDQKHEAMSYDDVIALGKQTTLRLIIKKFSFENKRRFRCEDKLVAHAEQIQCIDDAIQQAELPCRFPFIKSRTDLKPCNNLNETKAAIYQLFEVYDEEKITNCHGKKQVCKETIYGYQTSLQIPSINKQHSSLIVNFPDDTFEMVLETFTYSFSALLSDVGGSLGFFLGVSIITFCEAFDQLLRKVIKLFRVKVIGVYSR